MEKIKKFYNHCIERYGYKTCIFVQQYENSSIYDFLFLDNSENSRLISNSQFFNTIPDLLQKKYTVVIINYTSTNYLDIIAVHQPEQKQLNLPPIFM